jgi:predicted N-acyltransferase
MNDDNLMMVPHGIQILKTIDKIGKIAVDSIADDGFFTYGYFKTLETAKPYDVLPFYLSVFNEYGINAVAPCLVESFNNKITTNAVIRKALKISDKIGLFPNSMLNSYSPNSFHSKILIRDISDEKSNLDAVLTGIDLLCKKERISFSSFQYVSEFDGPLIDRLEKFGYLKMQSIKTLYLDVQWTCFEDYLESLGKKTRKNVRREIKKCKENGITILEENDFGKLSEKLSRLQSNLFSKYNNGAKSPYSASFFERLSEYAKDKTKVFTAWKDGKLVGFSLCLLHCNVMDVYFCGFDYESWENTDFAYFNLAVYEPIKLAINSGLKRIHFRIGAENVKLKRGCKEETNYWFIKCQNTLFRPIFNFSGRKNTVNFNDQT